jgi:hypothetical protein
VFSHVGITLNSGRKAELNRPLFSAILRDQ